MQNPHLSRSSHGSLFIFSFVFLVLILIGWTPAVRSQTTQPDVEAKLLSMPDADYPSLAKDAWIGGNVNVRVNVDEKGRVTNAVVAYAPGAVCTAVATPSVVALRTAAVAAASQASFSPAMSGTTPVPSIQFVTVEFKAAVPAADGSVRPKIISAGVLNAKAVSLPVPAYPAAAKAVNASGSVNIETVISEDGTVYSARAVSGHPLLRQASEQAACGSKFTPVLLSGEPVKVAGIIVYNFNL